MAAKRPPNSVQTTPSGIRVEFWDSVGLDGEKQQRRYRVNGERFVNVTTITGILDKPALLDWAAELARNGENWRDVRDDASDRGKAPHDLLMRVVLDQRTSLSDYPEAYRPWLQGAYRWVLAREPEVEQAECMVAAPSHGFAGRLDLLARVKGREGLGLIDYKSTGKWSYKKGKGGEPTDELLPPYDENLLQLDLYSAAIGESGYPEPDWGLIVRLGPDGNYDETFVDLQPDRGLGILRAYRCKAAASTALRDARKALVAA